MGHLILIALLPWLGLLAVLVAVGWLVWRASASRMRWRRLAWLHANQHGSVQSLSFVLTLPVFIMVLMLIVQVSQLMVGTIVVHYAAYAAARAAIVAIPSRFGAELENCIGTIMPDPTADNVFPQLDWNASNYGPTDGGVTYLVVDGRTDGWIVPTSATTVKCRRVALAAALACTSISPSRSLGLATSADPGVLGALTTAYSTAATNSAASSQAISQRLANKLGYAMSQTGVQIRFFHSNRELPLQVDYDADPQFNPEPAPPYSDHEFKQNELGWQDMVNVTVQHNFALLPGPARLFALFSNQAGTGIQSVDGIYTFTLRARAAMSNEGDKSVVAYDYSTR